MAAQAVSKVGSVVAHQSRRIVEPSLLTEVLAFLPAGGSLPPEIWRARHKFLLGLTWFHAGLIVALGPLLGYSRELSFAALFANDAVLHTLAEGLVVVLFAALATWGTKRRVAQASATGLGLMTASAVLVHTSGGYIEFHFHFFVMVAFLALYQDWVPYLLAILYVAIHHGVVGVLWPEQVYNHAAAIGAPWTWAGIHAFFIACAAIGSLIAWRFNEKAFAEAKLILDAAGEGIYGLDRDGKVTFMNTAAGSLLRCSPEEAKGKPIERLQRHTRADGSNFSDHESPILLPLNNGGKHQSSEEVFWRQDGTSFPVEYVAGPIYERGVLSGVVVTFTDITRRKQRQRALEESEERFRQLAAQNARLLEETAARAQEQEALNGVAKAITQSLRRDELLDTALDKVREVTGRERVSIRIKDLNTGQVPLVAHRGFSPEEVEELAKTVRHSPTERVLASAQPLVVNSRSEFEDSQALLANSDSVAWIPMKAGAQVVGILGISTTSSVPFSHRELEFLQAIANMIGVALENARLFSETEARSREFEALHAIGNAILDTLELATIMERILDQALEIGRFDMGVVRILDDTGHYLQPVASRGYRDPSNLENHRKKLNSFTSGAATSQVLGDKSVHVLDLSRTDGLRTFKKEGVCTLVAIPLRIESEILGVIQLGSRSGREFHDSELRIFNAIGGQAGIAVQKASLYEQSKRAQAALAEKAEELARSNTELEHFAYIASHDLQEPLRMVASYVQLLARRYKGKLDAEADELIGFAVDGATRMQALINALLAYSRIGTKATRLETVDCAETVAIALKDLQVAVAESNAVVTHDRLPTVTVDGTQLRQLFQNLIANAIKFRGANAPKVHLSAERKGNEWVFSCRDNGIGIEAQFSERIFVIFQRLHRREEYPGTGIGLALCKKIIERHGGRIWVESEVGKGANFRFTLPHSGSEAASS